MQAKAPVPAQAESKAAVRDGFLKTAGFASGVVAGLAAGLILTSALSLSPFWKAKTDDLKLIPDIVASEKFSPYFGKAPSDSHGGKHSP